VEVGQRGVLATVTCAVPAAVLVVAVRAAGGSRLPPDEPPEPRGSVPRSMLVVADLPSPRRIRPYSVAQGHARRGL
jgi:hypothetical protein